MHRLMHEQQQRHCGLTSWGGVPRMTWRSRAASFRRSVTSSARSHAPCFIARRAAYATPTCSITQGQLLPNNCPS